MQKSTIVLLVLGLVVIAAAGWAYSKWDTFAPATFVQETTNSDGTTTQVTVNTDTGTTTPGAQSFTLADIATHNNASSCYTAISGKVYDLTLWINMHPGGKNPILSLCGNDGTTAFMNKHKGAQKQMDILSRFHIGNLSLR